nr:metallophosphoesterase [Candidatus Woesearchaeota archaeon]
MNTEVIHKFLENGFLPSPDITEDFQDIENILNNKNETILCVVNNDLLNAFSNGFDPKANINWHEFDKSKALFEMGRDNHAYNVFLDILNYNNSNKKQEEIKKLLEEVGKEESKIYLEDENSHAGVVVIKTYQELSDKIEVDNFVSYLKSRYNFMKSLFLNRSELINSISLNRVKTKQEREGVSIIGIVSNKKITKKGNLLVTLEDPTGSIDLIINKQNEIFEDAKNIVLDEVIGITGICGQDFVFVNKVFFPDIPLTNELKKTNDEVYAAFISDVHVGSRLFLKDNLLKFFDWLNGKSINLLNRNIGKKVKYLFVVGDLVDGVGIYPEQFKELDIKDVKEQYREAAELFSGLRKDLNIIICPGQHDALRISEPQPFLDKEIAKPMWGIENVTLVSNPCLVNIHASKNFPGFDVLMYHGASFHYYIDSIDSLRQSNARDNPTEVLKFLLKKRHLAPSHSSTLYIPYKDKDPLIIEKVPDIFVSGEMHRSSLMNYNNVSLINCSCWQGKTDYQEKTGNNPDPCRVPIMNLKTREVKIYNFD